MKEILESLREYASATPADVPQEILLWDHRDPWGLDGAARTVLDLPLKGETPGDRLFEMTDYLLTFCVEGYGTPQFPDAPLLNGTALALCGYLWEGAA